MCDIIRGYKRPPFFMSENPEEFTVDIPAEVVAKDESEQEHWTDQISEKERREFERKRITQINKTLKHLRRREKNFMTIINKMDTK